jgi:hypothetical protein
MHQHRFGPTAHTPFEKTNVDKEMRMSVEADKVSNLRLVLVTNCCD